MNNTKLWVAVALVGLIAIIGVYTPKSLISSLGGVTNYDEVDATAIKIGGSNGSRVGPLIAGSCTATTAVSAYVATSTAEWACAVTGVAAGDNVYVQTTNPILTNGLMGSFLVTNAIATTSNFIEVTVQNITGAATSSVSSAYMKLNYWVSHPVTSVPGL